METIESLDLKAVVGGAGEGPEGNLAELGIGAAFRDFKVGIEGRLFRNNVGDCMTNVVVPWSKRPNATVGEIKELGAMCRSLATPTPK